MDAKQRKLLAEYVGLYEEDLRRIAWKRKLPADAVEDLLQDVWLEAGKSLSRLRDPTKSKAWLRAILVNLINDYWRKEETVEIFEPTGDGNIEKMQSSIRDFARSDPFPTVSKKYCAAHALFTFRHGLKAAADLHRGLAMEPDKKAKRKKNRRLTQERQEQWENVTKRLEIRAQRLAEAVRDSGHTIPTKHFTGLEGELLPPTEYLDYAHGSWLYVRFPLRKPTAKKTYQAWLYALPKAMLPAYRKELRPSIEATETDPSEIRQWSRYRIWGAEVMVPEEGQFLGGIAKKRKST